MNQVYMNKINKNQDNIHLNNRSKTILLGKHKRKYKSK